MNKINNIIVLTVRRLMPRQKILSKEKIAAAAKLIFKTNRGSARLGGQEKIIFIKRLAILVESGIPIGACLRMLEVQSSFPAGRRLIGRLRTDVENGKPLAAAMENFHATFGRFAAGIVEVGEIGGTLASNLDYLAEELRRRRELKKNIIGALVYPAFIFVAILAITAFLIGYLFPKIMPVFASFKSELPWTTRTLISISAAGQNYWPQILAGVVFLAAVMPFLFKKPRVRYFFDYNLLRLPGLGKMFQSYYLANFSRNLGLLLAGNINIVRALDIAGQTADNLAYKAALVRIAAAVKRGGSIGQAMENEAAVFPPLASQMVSAGESSGNLSSAAIYLSRIYEDEMNYSAKNLAVSIEPALMVFMGILVGFVAVSIITPIYGITQLLQK